MPQSFSVLTGTFQRLLVLFKGFRPRFQKSFFCLSAWRSSIIPHLPPSVNTFRQVFEEKFEFSSFLSFAADFSSKKGPPALLHRRPFFLYYLYEPLKHFHHIFLWFHIYCHYHLRLELVLFLL